MNKEKCQLESRKNQRTPDYQKSNDFNDSSNEECFEPENTPQEELNNPLRRSERIKSKPKYLEDYAVLALNVEAFLDDVPKTFEEIKSRDDKEKWNQAVQEKITALELNNTWELVKLPVEKRSIDSKWVFKIKPDSEERQEHYKARLIIKGCSQRKGFDYKEIYAPVAKLTTIRTLLAIILEEDLFAYQMDVKNAFLHGTLKEEIYSRTPFIWTDREIRNFT